MLKSNLLKNIVLQICTIYILEYQLSIGEMRCDKISSDYHHEKLESVIAGHEVAKEFSISP